MVQLFPLDMSILEVVIFILTKPVILAGAVVRFFHRVILITFFRDGSVEQQITLYRWNDTNNHWLLLRPEQPFNKVERVEWIQDGDIVTLMHMNTFRKLHSHKNKPMVTDAEGHTEVT